VGTTGIKWCIQGAGAPESVIQIPKDTINARHLISAPFYFTERRKNGKKEVFINLSSSHW
jgi:hypothetical protein